VHELFKCPNLKYSSKMLRRMIPRLNCVVQMTQLRSLTKLSTSLQEVSDDKMQAWQIHSYNGLSDLKLSNVRIPVLRQPTDVLVKVEAASVNSIDIAMTSILIICLLSPK